MPCDDCSRTECPVGKHCFDHNTTCCYCGKPEPRCEGCGHTDGEGCGCSPERRSVELILDTSPAALKAAQGFEEERLRHHADCEDCDVLDPCPCCGLRIAVREQPADDTPEDRPICVCGFDPHAGEEEHRADCPVFHPPQPERRPPYAVAYSAGGHAYEALLPGDAIVSAVDGRLVIEHQGFPVLAIERVMPVSIAQEETSGG